MSTDVFMRWSNHCGILIDALQQMRRMDTFTDCVIIAEGRKVRVHKVILAAFSPYFEIILKEHSNYHMLPIVVVTTGISYESVKLLVDYMYGGHVKVQPEEVGSLLMAAKNLQIKGVGESMNSEHTHSSMEHSHCAYSVAENPVCIPSSHCSVPVSVPVSAPLPVPSTCLPASGMLSVRNLQPIPVAASGPGPGTSHPPSAGNTLSDDEVVEVEVRRSQQRQRQRQRRSTPNSLVPVPAAVPPLTVATVKLSDTPEKSQSISPAVVQHDTLASRAVNNSKGNPKTAPTSSSSSADMVPLSTSVLESAGGPSGSTAPSPQAVEVSSCSPSPPPTLPAQERSTTPVASMSSEHLPLSLRVTPCSSREQSPCSSLSSLCFRARSSSSDVELQESPTKNMSFMPSVESVSQLLMETGNISAEVNPRHGLGRSSRCSSVSSDTLAQAYSTSPPLSPTPPPKPSSRPSRSPTARRGRSTARRGTSFRISQGSSAASVSSEQQPGNTKSSSTVPDGGQESRTVRTNLSDWSTFESAASTCKTTEPPPKKRRSGMSCRSYMGLRSRQSRRQPTCPPEKHMRGTRSAPKGDGNHSPPSP